MSFSGLFAVTDGAHAVTSGDLRAQAQRIEQQIASNGDRIAALGERYNGAVLDYQQAMTAVHDADVRMRRAAMQQAYLRRQVAGRALTMYIHAGRGSLPSTNVSSAVEFGVRQAYTAVAASHDEDLFGRLQGAREDLAVERVRFEKKMNDARQRRDEIAGARQAIEQANAREQHLLSTVKGQLAVLVRQEQQRREAEARAAALRALQQARSAAASAGAVSNSSSSHTPASQSVDPAAVGAGTDPHTPAPSSGVAAALAYARAQLGKPYVYAAAGPDTFDCSGLTMMAWRQAGVFMPHYSGAQFAMFPHIPLDQLQPGDLVFKGPGGSEHVAMYVGGGMQIAATHTGDYVRLQPLGSNLVGAARPG